MKIIFNTGYVFSEYKWQQFLASSSTYKMDRNNQKLIEDYLNNLDHQNMDEDYTKLFVDKDPDQIGFKRL